MNTLATLFSKPLAIFTVDEPPQVVSSRLKQLNKQPFMPNPNVFPESRIEKSDNTNALFRVSLGSATAYINLYLDAQNLGQTGVRISLARIHDEPLFWSLLYMGVMSIFGLYLLQRDLIGGMILYGVLIALTYYVYRQTINRQKSDLLILLNDIFPEQITRKRKKIQSRWSLLEPTPFEFMTSKPIDRISELIRSATQLDIENRRRLVIRQHTLNAIEYEAVVQVISRYGQGNRPSVAMSLQVTQTDKNDIQIAGELFETRKLNFIYELIFIWNFSLIVWLATSNLVGALVFGGFLTFVLFATERIQPFQKEDINDLTDFIYQTLA